MKVLLLGGYGVFGERLARLLVKDGHEVCIAGRNLKTAQTLAAELGCQALRVDRAGPLDALAEHEIIIDAAGPFDASGDNPYRLAQAAITAGVHYLDLSDNADFCAGISTLNEQAERAGLCVISGMSSVPAISSAAVTALAENDVPLVIDSAILPGNRSPRGIAVMQSILTRAGRPMPVWRGRRWERQFGWSRPANYHIPDGLIRQAWQIEVPDQHLFPAHFGAETVLFRAGLELGVMRYGLALFAALRRVVPLPVGRPIVLLFKFLADILAKFGTDRGGMSVMVVTAHERRSWSLLAEGGEGPFIPAVAARALLRRPDLPVGARAALGVITLDEVEAAMTDLKVKTERTKAARDPIFRRVLGDSFAALGKPIRATHLTADKSYWEGRCGVERGSGVWSQLLATLFGFPPTNPDTSVKVVKSVTGRGETWQRCFDNRNFRSHLAATPDGMTERFGPFTFLLGLQVKEAALHFPVKSGRLGPFALPRWLLPVSEAREYVLDDIFHFDVALRAPLTNGLIVRYRGWLVAAKSEDPAQPPRFES